ncbi:menaquinone biosynthetic enzyme MqnA/MqnD family protein [Paenibacillus flagellatus]|uniref:Chorismate dehydratase n=1 Tax=Paenibacillus flagellatus TaxID=2211139 RepID=A0A2V5KAN1_9BACL|nr:menaquinone biosynthesis protein [Paenibacillus flagellatus]PYI54923.1 ABC transporter substrate-binding protein [Paenibacillus flagellatus]
MQQDSRIRIGKIHYTNVWPIYHHFPHERFGSRLEWIEQVPTGLNKAMLAGEVDMGAISSFAYAESHDRYELYPELSVSAYGNVNSLLLFHKKPLSELDGATVMLPTTSATTVNLLKIVLGKFVGVTPNYVYAAPSLDTMMKHADAALLIGDDAIRASWREHPYEVSDMGGLWQRYTGEWMTFAVWAVRKETIRAYPELVAAVHEAFLESKAAGLRDPDPIVRKAQGVIGGTEAYWRGYFRNLSHDFGPDQRRGLSLYFRYAEEMGLLPEPAPLHMWADNSVTR